MTIAQKIRLWNYTDAPQLAVGLGSDKQYKLKVS